MNGIENIMEKIRSEAETEVQALESRIAEECAAIREKGERDARQIYDAVLCQRAEQAALQAERAKSAAVMEAKKQILAEKQALLQEAFQKAVELLCEQPETRYVDLLARLAAQSASGTERLVFSPSDRNRVGEKVVAAANRLLAEQGQPASLTLSDQARDIRGGVILERGQIEINCSFEALVEQSRSRLTGEVAGLLFE